MKLPFAAWNARRNYAGYLLTVVIYNRSFQSGIVVFGYTFLIGFLAENRVVRINRFKDNEGQTKNSLITIIHPLSKKLIKI